MTYARLFSLEEAQQMLKSVRPKLEEIVRLKQTLDRKGYDVYRHQYLGGMGPNGQKMFPDEMELLVELLRQLNEEGVEVKDFNRGLIDFPHKRGSGEIVYLCYLLGEPQIEAWHSIESGFAGRRPLAEL
jgi:hypothetical protein